MAGKRKKHKPKYKPKHQPSPNSTELSVEQSETPLVVFVSSQIDKMREDRDAVRRAIASIPATRPWQFDYAPVSSQELEESYLSNVRKCDIFVLILGEEYSDPVNKEYQTALENRKPILIFIRKGTKKLNQQNLIDSLNTKYALYTTPEELEQVVYTSVVDELIRRFKTTLGTSDAPRIVANFPLAVRRFEEMSAYVVIGLEDTEIGKILFEPFGGETPPEDIKQLNPAMEPVFFDNLSEMQEVFVAIRNAATRARISTGDHQKSFLRELKSEASEIASRYIVRQRTKKPEPQITIPGLKYFIWGMAPDIARMMRIMRPEEIVSGPKPIQRTENEYFFTDANYLVKVFAEIYEAGQKAAGNDEEFLRLLLAGAMRLRFLGVDDNDL
jgi:Domain of unknown function (DUF4062)